MKLIITDDKLEIELSKAINSGSINYYNIECEFNSAWNNLTKEIILKSNNNAVKRVVVDGIVNIDQQIKGIYQIGAKGYSVTYTLTTDITVNPNKIYYTRAGTEGSYVYSKVENPTQAGLSTYYEAEKTLQISTGLKRIPVNEGAGEIETMDEGIPTPTEFESYIHQIQTVVEEASRVDIDIKTVGESKKVEITRRDGTKKEATISTGGTSDHSLLSNLDYANSGHTGFQPTISDLETIRSGASAGATAIQDNSYVHTDNNYTTSEKTKLAGLSNYDDTEVRSLINGKVDKVSGKGLSTNDYTTEEKNKLAGIDMSTKQDTLISGTNIKTINNQNILGSGNLEVLGQTIQYETMPTASSSNVGKIVEYVGETGTYTKGYFYENINTEVQESITATQTDNGVQLGTITLNNNTLKSQLNAGTHEFVYRPYDTVLNFSNISVFPPVMIQVTRDSTFDRQPMIPNAPKMYSWVDNSNNFYITNTLQPNALTKLYLLDIQTNETTDTGTTFISSNTPSQIEGRWTKKTGDVYEDVEISDYGILLSSSGLPWNTIQVVYTPYSNTYNWTQKNVQPSSSGGTTDFDELTNRPSYNGTAMTHTTNIPEVKTATWDGKQDAINDLATIRSGANAGATAVQDNNYVHTDNNYTSEEKTKLAEIETGAEVNTIEGVQVGGSDLTPDANKKVNISYATGSTAGVIKIGGGYGSEINNQGWINSRIYSYGTYPDVAPESFMSKGTFENAITGKGLLSSNDIINDVAHTDTNKTLSANMGKELNDRIDSLSARGRFLSNWNMTTGLPTTNPISSGTYEYRTGDYYIVSVVSVVGATNYKPNGSSYTLDIPSTTEETNTVLVGDTYRYDGTNWILEVNTERTTTFANISGQPTDNSNLASALNNKVGFTDYPTLNTGGVIKTDYLYYNLATDNGSLYCATKSFQEYTDGGNSQFISKGTLENVITGKGLGTYSKPNTGIPKSDLASDVQTSLGLADSALQTHQDISGKENTSNKSDSYTVSSSITYSSTKALVDGLATKQPTIDSTHKLPASNVSGLSTVATSGSYNDLSNKPTIPSAVTESTVSGWGFTKNTGTYSKPSGGIPKTDLASAVQTSLGKADSALQSHQDISGKLDSTKCTYQTTAPASAISDGGVHIVYLSEEPATRYAGYTYVISQSLESFLYTYADGTSETIKFAISTPIYHTLTANITNGTYSGPSTISENESINVTISANSGYVLPSSVTVTNATYTYDNTTGIISLSSVTGSVTITAVCPALATYSITTNVTNGSHTGSTTITVGSTASVNISANNGYKLPTSVTVSGATYTYNSTTGVISLSNPTANVTINASCVQLSTYTITTNVTGGSYSGDSSIVENGTASVTITPTSGYALPGSITVSGATYSYNNSTGVISLSNPTANVSIAVACTPPVTYTITTNVTNGTYSGATSIVQGGTATVTISATSGYNLPSTVTVTGATQSYNSSTGIITLSAPTGNVTITAVCASSSRLPEGYTETEWTGAGIDSEGTSTGVNKRTSTAIAGFVLDAYMKVVMEVETKEKRTTYIDGVALSGGKYLTTRLSGTSGWIECMCNGSLHGAKDSAVIDTKYKVTETIDLRNSGNAVTFKVEQVTQQGSSVIVDTSGTATTTYTVGGTATYRLCGYYFCGPIANYLRGKMYSYKIYKSSDGTDTLAYDFVPCYRNSDSVAGFYELVNGVFYSNTETSDAAPFVAGPAVN